MKETNFYAIVLAAGKGKRMRDEAAPPELPKVLREVCGRPLIAYVLDVLRAVGILDISLIVGFGADHVRQALGEDFNYIVQDEQLGSGHAVACAKAALSARGGHVVIMCGDSPAFRPATISTLMEHHVSAGAAITLISTMLDDPTGYGRIKRNPSGEIVAVVEEKCASPDEKSINEINGGAYAFDSNWLWENIDRIERNEAGELNLTDLVRVAIHQRRRVEAVPACAEDVMGVNTPDDLRRVQEIVRHASTR
ncbi:MAG: NTP transferase domain-containing protein [Armatimonadetes bacterium]|nr:NTP transferase domain-containing protein [Armatimonadota bacterium]